MIKEFKADKKNGIAAFRLWDIPNDAIRVEVFTEANDAGIILRSFDDLDPTIPQETFVFAKVGFVVTQLPVGTWTVERSDDGKKWRKWDVEYSFWPKRAESNFNLVGNTGDAKVWYRWTKQLTKK